MRYIFEAWLFLLSTDVAMRLLSFKSFCGVIGRARTQSIRPSSPEIQELCDSMDFACAFYFKRVRCLQRSAATTLLLRRHGREAQMVIGARTEPFRSHAWVEAEKRIVNDSVSVVEGYRVLVRC